MVEAFKTEGKPDENGLYPMNQDEITDEQIEAMRAAMPKSTPDQIEADMEEWINHPLNCKELTPKMLEQPEFQALMQMSHEGTPQEVAENFKHHAYEHLGALLLKKSKNEEKDFQESLYCFDQALEAKCGDPKLEYDLYLGRAKLNILRAQCGLTKEDCLEALKIKDSDPVCWTLLCKSRLYVEKYDECTEYLTKALDKFPENPSLKQLKTRVLAELEKEKEKAQKIEMIREGKENETVKVYRALRSKGIKLGKRLQELPEMVDQRVTVDKKGKLHFPVLILYEQFGVTDFIQDFCEDERLAQQLRPIFNEQAPWDSEGIYRMDTIEVYFEADMTKLLDPKEAPKRKSTTKYIKCGINQTLLSILQHENYAVPQYPIISIISKEDEDFKEYFLGQI